MKMAFKHTRTEIIALGLTCTHQEGEIRIAYRGQPESAYFTNCLADALATARHMAAALN